MKVWKKAVSAALCICLVASLFTGFSLTDVAAAEYGTLQNGAFTENTTGWTVAGDMSLAETGSETAGYWNTTESGTSYLSIWNSGDDGQQFSISQTIENLEEGTYTAKVAAVGNAASKANKSLKMTVKNDTQDVTVSADVTIDDWNTWDNVVTADSIEVAEGDSVTISFAGTMLKGDWYGLKDVSFDAATAVEAPINVKKVSGLSKDFIHGVDVSTYMSEIQSGVKYYNEDGEEENMFQIFKDGGVNYVRIRVWNCPFRIDDDGKYLYVDDEGNEYNEDKVTTTKDANGFPVYTLTEGGTTVYREGYGAGNCDIDTAEAIGKIATSYGMKVLIDFHYSDFWADPAKYKVPKAWAGMDIDVKAEALAEYTTACLQQLKDAGVDVGMVQVGNEINGGMAGENKWDNMSKLLKAGTKAVRDFDENILIAIHYADPHKSGYQVGKAKALNDAGIDYDVFASSYYSFWHGSTDNLTSVLKTIADTYNKKVMVAEVSYCSTLEDGDGAANVVNSSTSPLNYSIDAEGQAAAVRDAIAAVSAVGDAGIGTFYWEPAWIPAQNYAGADEADKETVLANNIDKWEKYGSGWASKWSGKAGDAYDGGVDDDESTHGSQWDNQAMFDFDGKALPSINVYKWVYTGADGPVRVSTVDTTSYTMNYKDTPDLPAAVNVNLNDGRTVENVGVTWDAEQLEALKTADFGEYTITGSLNEFAYDSKGETLTIAAGTYATTCAVTVTGTNYAVNAGFEDGSNGWTLTDTSSTGAKVKSDGAGGNAKSGNGYFDAWSKSPIDFTIEQTIAKEDLPSRKYTLSAYYQGTNVAEIAEEAGLFAEVTYKNGAVKRYDADFEIPNVWKQFYQAKISNILVNDHVADIRIGTHMACTGNSNGAWVVIDDVNLMAADALTDEEASYIEPVDTDKSALNAAIEAAEKLSEKDYTAESYKAFSDALTAAKAAAASNIVSQTEVDGAKAALDAAVAGLKKTETSKPDNGQNGGGESNNQTPAPTPTPTTNPTPTPETVKVSSITVASKSYKIAAGKKVTITPEVAPANAANTAVTYESSNTKYATVNEKGVVTTKKAGAGKTVTITVTAADGSGVKTDVKVTIMKHAVKKIKFTAKPKSIKAGKKATIKAKVTTTGKKANKTLEWTSSNTKYATVSQKGVVKAAKAGAGKTVTITARSTDGTNKKVSVKIKIKK